MLEMNDHSCHVLWEDRFVSWEKKELLTVDVELTKRQTIRVSSDVNHPLQGWFFMGEKKQRNEAFVGVGGAAFVVS